MTEIEKVVGLLLFGSVVAAQTGSSSLFETIDWLSKNLGGAACVVFQMGESTQKLKPVTENTEVRFAQCDMTVETATTIGPRSELRTFHLPLGQLKPMGVTLVEGFKIPAGWVTAGDVPTHTIRLAMPPNSGEIDATFLQFDGAVGAKPSRYQTNEVNILVRHKDVAEKLVTALSRAIELCRTK